MRLSGKATAISWLLCQQSLAVPNGWHFQQMCNIRELLLRTPTCSGHIQDCSLFSSPQKYLDYYADLEIEANEEYYIAPKYDLGDICGDEPLVKVNVNDGSKEELMSISGIGDAIASQIISYRNENGIFYCLEDLMNVNGIGNATFEKLKDSIYLHE